MTKAPEALEKRSSARPTILHRRDQRMSADLCEPEKCFRRRIRKLGYPRTEHERSLALANPFEANG